MKKLHSFTAASFAILASLSMAASSFAQDTPQNVDPAELQKVFENFIKLGPEHKEFQRVVGQWDAVQESFYENPEEPQVDNAKATFQVILGGRYLQQNYKGSYAGQPFEGMGITGFDNAKKKYVSIWIDNMGTGIATMEGAYDVDTHKLTEIGVASSPFGEVKMRAVTHYVDEDHILFTMYMVGPDKKEQKAMEIAYTRSK